ncbi:unnamed protein product [Triticum turgidum subsp. durum]|uniref:Transmembrane protein n=1 Tax=Triticum turgidum subsp. durum TaxID=4567 RepID=A0A9R0XQ82_TRITD|nr:unnamed protein product [Triticum turgidum subsp. durum]
MVSYINVRGGIPATKHKRKANTTNDQPCIYLFIHVFRCFFLKDKCVRSKSAHGLFLPLSFCHKEALINFKTCSHIRLLLCSFLFFFFQSLLFLNGKKKVHVDDSSPYKIVLHGWVD